MNKFSWIIILTVGLTAVANAEMYKWMDENGDVHFSDRPLHSNAGKIRLAYSSGSDARQSVGDDQMQGDEGAPEESERKRAEAYFCKQATDAYESYKSAPSLYETDEDGERRYLSDDEIADLLEDTQSKILEWCK